MIDKPSWLYKSVNVENIEIIKKECSDIVTKHFPNIFGDRGFTFTYVDKDILRNEAPTYVQILKDFNLYDKWATSVFVGTVGEKRFKDSPIHVDSENWQDRCYAFNMPVFNCHDSHTVFYHVTEPDEYAYTGGDAGGYKSARGFKEESSKEIGRWNVENPAWVNVSIPHRAENNNADPRLLISTRFWPEIHDYFTE